MKVFITGSEGFIGSHLTEYLLKKNYKLRCLYQYNSFNNKGWLEEIDKKLLKKAELVAGDIRDQSFLKNEIKGCDVVIHLAALIAIPFSYKSVNSFLETNTIGTLNVLEACKEHKIKKLICTSTSEVYGTGVKMPMEEDHRLLAQSPYSASKIAADQFAISYHLSFGLPVTILRPFNTFGPRQSLRAVIPTIINQAINGKKKLNLGLTSTSRDFNFIEDVTNAFEKSLKSKKDIGQVINIGTGREITIGKLAKTIYQIMGLNLKLSKDKKRLRPKKSEVLRLKASNLKAKKFLNWKPKISNEKLFRVALEKTINWYRKKENRRKFKDNSFIL
tara:strand:- start:448 stop:1443 length:996 start_codon:yes stop_codon:yes gene_type:complete